MTLSEQVSLAVVLVFASICLWILMRPPRSR